MWDSQAYPDRKALLFRLFRNIAQIIRDYDGQEMLGIERLFAWDQHVTEADHRCWLSW
jgi:hypothetical protein